ncbi:hypothetical protein PAHAL_5G018000 [Panicum hallii]|uniref:Mitochondrial fission 1 protein n=1 Tax=Panicum hallii TaxID=206008 RepID=A0A2T8III5_9POAL|nr:hypothetical protein PAHAL_5G018000 [Panicum hallii]
MAMDAKIGRFFDAVGSFFSGGESIPWCDRDVIAGCEREVAEAATEEHEKQSIMRLSWALVHSTNQDDVLRGIGMLQASLLGATTSPLQAREKLYLLAVGHYRNGDYPRSRQFLDQCLEVVRFIHNISFSCCRHNNGGHCSDPHLIQKQRSGQPELFDGNW